MRWPAFLLAFVLALSFVVPPVAADDAPSLGDAPIQHHGRIKPLDTFARVNLLATYGKRSADDLTAMDWMLDLTTAPEESGERKLFKIRNPKAAEALALPGDREKHLYSFNEVSANSLCSRYGAPSGASFRSTSLSSGRPRNVSNPRNSMLTE